MEESFSINVTSLFPASVENILKMGNKTEVTSLTLSLKRRELACVLAIPRPIHQAATKQLIGSMAHGDVLSVRVTSEDLKHLGLKFTGFDAVLYEDSSRKICFIMKQAMQDVVLLLCQYYAQNPSSISVVEVGDCHDFNELTKKTGVGAGGKKYNYKDRFKFIGTYWDFWEHINNSQNWVTLNKEKIRCAFEQIPAQDNEFSCGMNSGARALVLAGHFNTNYHDFARNSPMASEVAGERFGVTRNIGVGTFALSGLLAFFPLTAPIAAGMAISGWTTAAVGMAGEAVCDSNPVGPSPHYLANYITNRLHSSSVYKYCKVQSYNCFQYCADAIIQDMKLNDPVIVFLLYEPTAWHYINVVGVQERDKFMVLETNQSFNWISYDDMEYLMRNTYKFLTFFGCKGHIGTYNILRFYKRDA